MHLDTNNHSVFLLSYHLVLIVKYKREVINNDISVRLKEIFEKISFNYNISIEEYKYDSKHIHIFFKAHPNSELSKFINAYKSASSRLIKKEFPEIKNKLWKENFWSRSYLLLTTGAEPMEVIKKYIENQKNKSDDEFDEDL